MADEEKQDLETERQKFLQSLLNRGPNKRQIKPVENSPLLQYALGEAAEDDEDSDEDEDFEFDEHDDDDGSGSDEDDDHNMGEGGDYGGGANDEDEDDESDSSEEDSIAVRPSITVGQMIAKMKETTVEANVHVPKSSSGSKCVSKKADLVICGICLDDISDEGDEIVECDNCGITVHEGCYGINEEDKDDDSDKSNETDSLTEPWFCDACQAGIQPDCELCPNLSGIFKETDAGQWVHLLCALYTPGVAFVKPESLESVTLSELPNFKWGAKDCCLCEDERFSRTGVCISCDAGMCRTFFHVTCAQMHGLLSEVPEECDEDIADPLFAHCKQHAEKKTRTKRRNTWLAFNSHYKKVDERRSEEDKPRIQECLKRSTIKYEQEKKKRTVKPYVPTERLPRLLDSCPGACRQLFRKAELLGLTSKQSLAESTKNVRRKWYIPPALTIEFVNYYHDRDARLKAMQDQRSQLETNNMLLQQEEQSLRTKYDQLLEEFKMTSGSVKKQRDKSSAFHMYLGTLANKELDLPSVLEPKTPKSPKSKQVEQQLEIHTCATCNKTDNQHLMVDCDTCHNYYHLACVDPPLTRMPKKSKVLLWQCSECDGSEDSEEVSVDVDDDTPLSQGRQRRVVKEPTKFTPDKPSFVELDQKKKHKHKENRGRKRKASVADGEKSSETKKKGRPLKQKTEKTEKESKATVGKPKDSDSRTACVTCKKNGNNMNLVRCDNCKLCYHFTCLDPPVKSNPKKRGYLWFCTDCDESGEESEDGAPHTDEDGDEKIKKELKFSDQENETLKDEAQSS